MSEIISRELLNEVLGYKLKIDRVGAISYSELNYFFEDGDMESINIRELAHKCKVWAFSKGVSIYCIQYKVDNGEYCLYLYDIDRETEILDTRTDVMSFATEPEAIFKACQWILGNKDSK